MDQACRCKRCIAHLPHTPFDETGLVKLLDRLHPPVYPRPARRLPSYDRHPHHDTVTPILRHGGNTRQPWEPRPARHAA